MTEQARGVQAVDQYLVTPPSPSTIFAIKKQNTPSLHSVSVHFTNTI